MPGRERASRFPEWETLLAHAALLQTRLPNAVLVGGTAAALHADHRFSFDHDHVVADLEKHYAEAIAALESIVGWRTARRIKGTLVLGTIDGIDARVRSLRRSAPLDTTTIDVGGGRRVKVPTIEEMLRIKTFLVIERSATRDYLDVAALSHHLGLERSADALESMNALYAEFAGEGGSMLATAVTKLAAPDPFDLTDVDLTEYKGISPPWSDWTAVCEQCRSLAAAVLTQR
jgi:hypothetical protein